MTISRIGTTGTPAYSTVALWRAACPANLVTANDQWIGEIGDEELTVAATVNFTGITTDATRYVELRAASGAAWTDNPASPLKYGTAGARLTTSVYGGSMFSITGGQKDIRFTRLQLIHTGTFGADPVINASGSLAEAAQVDRCIIEGYSSTSGGVCRIDHSSGYIARSVVVQRRSSGAACVAGLGGGAQAFSSIFACTTPGAATNVLGGGYVSGVARNCGLFGGVALSIAGRTYQNCVTNLSTGLPTGVTTAAFSTSTGAKFTNITDGTHDFRITSGSTLIGAGVADATYFPTDAFGTTAGTPPSIGPMELAAPASSVTGDAVIDEPTAGGGAASAADLSGNATIDEPTAGGGLESRADLSGGATIDEPTAGGGLAAATIGILTSGDLKDNTGAVHSNAPFEARVYSVADGSLVLRKTGLTSTTSATAPKCSFQDAPVAQGTQYYVHWIRTDSGQYGVELLTAT